MRSKWTRCFWILAMLCVTTQTAANLVFYYDGTVTGGSGAALSLTPVGEQVRLMLEITNLQPNDSISGSDITSLELTIGGLCVSTFIGTGTCSSGSSLIPIINIETEMMVFAPSTNGPFEGELNFLASSLTFPVQFEFNIDFSNLSFTSNLFQLGAINGCLDEGTPESEPCYTPVPLPGAVVFLGSALLLLGTRGKRGF